MADRDRTPASRRRRPQSGRRVREADSTERGLRLAIVFLAIGMTIAAGIMVFQGIAARQAPPSNYYDFQIRQWQKTIRDFPRSPVGYENLGFIYYKAERYREAASTLKKAIALDPKRVMSHVFLGRTYVELEQDDQAIRYLLKGAQLSTPSNKAAPYFELGELYEKKKDTKRAVEYYETSLKDDPNTWNSHVALARIYTAQGKRVDALEHSRIALALQGSDAKREQEIRRLTVQLVADAKKAKSSGDTKEAKRILQAVRESGIAGSRAEALLELGLILESEGNAKEAIKVLELGIKDGGNPDPQVLKTTYEHLATLYSSTGQASKAAEARKNADKY